jgi:hypothetical protein
MKSILVVVIASSVLLVAGLTFTACNSSGPQSSNTVTAKQYTCTMHPEVIKDKPGKCPKCDMDLVPKP